MSYLFMFSKSIICKNFKLLGPNALQTYTNKVWATVD